MHCFVGCRDTNGFQFGKIKPVLSDALRCFEINMGKDTLFAVERDNFKTNAHAALADFLGIKTAGWEHEIVNNMLDQCGLPTSGTPRKQNSFSHITEFECVL